MSVSPSDSTLSDRLQRFAAGKAALSDGGDSLRNLHGFQALQVHEQVVRQGILVSEFKIEAAADRPGGGNPITAEKGLVKHSS